MNKLLITSLLVSLAFSQDLFISEYIEGSGNNRAIEIYNGTETAVDLSGYAIKQSHNGTGWGEDGDGGSSEPLDGMYYVLNLLDGYMLQPDDVFVIANSQANDQITGVADTLLIYGNGDGSKVAAFTGNDGMGLFKGCVEDNCENGILIDVIGSVDGEEPWDVAGESQATIDHTLVRKSTVTSGNDDWAASAGTDANDSEWVVYPQNTSIYLGSHPIDESICNDNTACNSGDVGDCTYAEEGYDCDGNAFINVTFNVNMEEQTVDTEEFGLELYLDDPYGYHDMSDDDGDGVWSVTLTTLFSNTTYCYKFKNGDEWEGNFNDLGCGCGEDDTYGNRTFTPGDSDITLDSVCFNSCADCEISTLPVANAGPDSTVYHGDLVTLDGSDSSDEDGTIIAYKWEEDGIDTVDLQPPNGEAEIVTFTAPDTDGDLVFKLTVWDNEMNADEDEITITVATLPYCGDGACNGNETEDTCPEDCSLPDVYINEIHYDNAGSDIDEAVEVVAPSGMTSEQLSQITLSLYNGNGGAVYGSSTLDGFIAGETVDGLTYYSLLIGLQNGAPDGVSLSGGGNVYQFLSYEGTLDATNGPAIGLTSTDIGVSESGSTEVGTSIQFYGENVWVSGVSASLGAVNPVSCSDDSACNYGQVGDCVYADSGFDCNGNAVHAITFNVNMADEQVSADSVRIYGLFGDWYDGISMSDDDGDGVYSVTVELAAGEHLYKFKNGEDWETVDNLPCAVFDDPDGDGEGYWDRSLTVTDSGATLDTVCFSSCTNCCPALGDLNDDGSWNVSDIVILANCILADDCDEHENGCAGLISNDGGWNVQDIVLLATCILAENCNEMGSGRVRMDDATFSRLIMKDNMVSIEADGFIGGVQMTLSHGDDFRVKMTAHALIADYLTTGNETRLLVIIPETDKLFSYSGDFEITELIVVNSHAEVSASLPLADSFSLSQAYPNPFNPVTSLVFNLPEDGNVMVRVYNLKGQVVNTLLSGHRAGGIYNLTWDASQSPSGIYFVKAESAEYMQTQKLMLIK